MHVGEYLRCGTGITCQRAVKLATLIAETCSAVVCILVAEKEPAVNQFQIPPLMVLELLCGREMLKS